MGEILTMATMKRKDRKQTAAYAAELKANATVREIPILRMSDIPPQARGRTRRAERDKAVAARAIPTKILTISDLPRRTVATRRMAAVLSKARGIQRIQGVQGVQGHKALGPKVFSDYVKNGAWKGRRCFIIGGGPSAKNLDFDLLHGELTIGINRAYEVLDPSILYGVDGQMWGWVEQGKCGEESKQKFNAYHGYKVWMAVHKVFPSDFYLINVDERGGHKIGSTSLLAFKNNSGYGAINLAAALGANPIYLIGFDMQGDKQGKQKWWHDGYPVDYGENVYEGYIRELNGFAEALKKSGVDVVNLNPKSALKCFTFGNYREVVRKKPAIPKGAIHIMTKPGMITAITPTGDRPLAFALCKHWMEMQTVRPDQWIVVDDGKVPTKAPAWATYIRRAPRPNDPPHTLNVNLKTAIPYVKGEKILIIEDDEYYAPKYVETLSRKLDEYEAVGISQNKYYHLPTGGRVQIPNTLHASLAQTGFRASVLPEFVTIVKQAKTMYVDMKLWQRVMKNGRGYLFSDGEAMLYVGMKGLPGRAGIGAGHRKAMYGKSVDDSRHALRKWIPKDYQVYLDIVNGKLTEDNVSTYFPRITGITVCQNTKDLMQRAYESMRRFHPDMPIIIIDGSDISDPCAKYVRGLQSTRTAVVQLRYNIGHGKGMCMGIDAVRTPYALLFDSDIEMLKSPVDAMIAMMEPDTFGVGWIEHTDYDGFGVGARKDHAGESMPYLHPYFQLMDVANYRKYHPYVHHGAPCYLTMLDIYKQGLSDRVLKEFPGLGHTAGKDHGWEGKPREYVRHDVRGTRNVRTKKGLPQIEGNWVRNEALV